MKLFLCTHFDTAEYVEQQRETFEYELSTVIVWAYFQKVMQQLIDNIV